MENQITSHDTERHFIALQAKLDELIRTYEQLAEENRTLRTQQSALLAEREDLIQKNEQSRARIDAMVARLRGLEQSP